MSWHKKGFQISKHDNKLGNKGQIEVEKTGNLGDSAMGPKPF